MSCGGKDVWKDGDNNTTAIANDHAFYIVLYPTNHGVLILRGFKGTSLRMEPMRSDCATILGDSFGPQMQV